MYFDPHCDAMNFLKYGFKGALLGATLGASISLATRNIPTFVLKKMFNFAKTNNFGYAK